MVLTIVPAASVTARVASKINSRGFSAWRIVGVIPVWIFSYFSAFIIPCTICSREHIGMKNIYIVPTSVNVAK